MSPTRWCGKVNFTLAVGSDSGGAAALADRSASQTVAAPRYWVCLPPGAPQRRVVRAADSR